MAELAVLVPVIKAHAFPHRMLPGCDHVRALLKAPMSHVHTHVLKLGGSCLIPLPRQAVDFTAILHMLP